MDCNFNEKFYIWIPVCSLNVRCELVYVSRINGLNRGLGLRWTCMGRHLITSAERDDAVDSLGFVYRTS